MPFFTIERVARLSSFIIVPLIYYGEVVKSDCEKSIFGSMHVRGRRMDGDGWKG